jgi:5-(carboxyamino)imidazole ribonucleotide mutase
VQMLAREHDQLRERLVEYHENLKEDVAVTSRDLHEMGTPAFKSHRE